MAAPVGLGAQWLHYPAPGTPRTKDGKADLNAPAPRGRDGKPDLSGIWEPEPTPIPEIRRSFPPGGDMPRAPLGSEPITKYFATMLADFKPGTEPLQPGVAMRTDDPALHCFPVGMPLFDTYPVAHKIVQTPGLVTILSEVDQTFRQIFTDGRTFPPELEPAWLGSSIGHWEGDTFVVETAGINDRTTLDLVGHTHTSDLRLTERFHRLAFGRMELQLTLDDQRTFTRSVIVKFNYLLFPDTDLIESFCTENEKDMNHSPLR